MWELILSTVSIVKEFRKQCRNFLIALLSLCFSMRRKRGLGSWWGIETVFQITARQKWLEVSRAAERDAAWTILEERILMLMPEFWYKIKFSRWNHQRGPDGKLWHLCKTYRHLSFNLQRLYNTYIVIKIIEVRLLNKLTPANKLTSQQIILCCIWVLRAQGLFYKQTPLRVSQELHDSLWGNAGGAWLVQPGEDLASQAPNKACGGVIKTTDPGSSQGTCWEVKQWGGDWI